MNRRMFLSSTIAGSLGMLAAPVAAHAFSEQSCTASDPACKAVAEHAELRARIDAYLRGKGLSDAEREAAMARAVCPFCGGPLS